MGIKIEKLDSCPVMIDGLPLKVVEMGNIISVQYMSRRNTKATIQMLKGGQQYVELSTGEVKDVTHHDTRLQQKKSLLRTFDTARGLINANVTDVKKVRWITLTYAENMMDTTQLYQDFRDFNKRFKRFCIKKGYGIPEYIVMMEPQGRGALYRHF